MITIALFILAGTLFLAYANGANDNFKGVATLAGSGTLDFRRALGWATITTLLGSVAAIVWATALLRTFSGKGLVADAIAAEPVFMVAVALAAGTTVIIATLTGLPISTTHALMGALVGSGLAATGGQVAWSNLGGAFVLPLLLSPFAAVGLALVAYPPLRWLRRRTGITSETCVCLETGGFAPLTAPAAGPPNGPRSDVAHCCGAAAPSLVIDKTTRCVERYSGRVLGVSAAGVADFVHFLSAGAVSFARGLNDTPKIVALLISSQALVALTGTGGPRLGFALVAVCIALGGLLNARRVARTMSRRITDMNIGQGLTANLVTAFLVLVASRFGMPVSTTHVSCGALFGIGTVTRQAHWRTIGLILLAWITTLPLAAALGAMVYTLMR
ncbi:MAG: anion permease [Phycisphaerae bacterium]